MKLTTEPHLTHPPRPQATQQVPQGDVSSGALRIAVIGSGHVGLVTAACLASIGHAVVAHDIDKAKVARLATGEIDFHEVGLPELLQAQMAAQRLRFVTSLRDAVADAALVIVTVATPARYDNTPDLGAIDSVVRELGALVRAPTVVAIKSTVPVGTAHEIQARLRNACADATQAARVISNPDFLREGEAVADFMRPARIIVGAEAQDGAARALLLRAYSPLIDAGVPVVALDTRSAELTAHAANAALAMRVSLVSEMAAIASATGADIEQVCAGLGSDPRIGSAFLRGGSGYGGSGLPKGVAALRETARRHNVRTDLLQAIERVNDRQRCWAFSELQRDVGSRGRLRGLRMAIWGLAFKPGTDDVRCAPSLILIDRLVRAGVNVALYDPAAMGNARCALALERRTRWASSASDALVGADALMLITEWPEFVAFDPAEVAAALRLRTVYDGRNALDAERWSGAGLHVRQVGRPPQANATSPFENATGLRRAPRGTRSRPARAIDVAA